MIATGATVVVEAMTAAAFGVVGTMEVRERELFEVQHETKLGSQTRGH